MVYIFKHNKRSQEIQLICGRKNLASGFKFKVENIQTVSDSQITARFFFFSQTMQKS